jgi:hypothetical protein
MLLQVQTHAATAFYQGLIDTSQRVSAMGMQLQVEQAIHQGKPRSTRTSGCILHPGKFTKFGSHNKWVKF